MARPSEAKIDKIKLLQLRQESKSIKYCADYFGTSEAAIRHALYRIRKEIRETPTEDMIGGNNIDAMKQLSDINANIISQLEKCNKLLVREDAKVKQIDELSSILEQNPNDTEARIRLERLMDSNLKTTLAIQNNMINISAEIRKQIELQLKIAEALYNIQMISEFQNEVISIIKSVDNIAAETIIARLKERRMLRGLVKLT